MPIDDRSDSVRLVEYGRNWVWKDVARHRSDPTSHIGPHTKAEPYQPSYQNLLAAGEGGSQARLPWVSQRLLNAPAEDTDEPLALARVSTTDQLAALFKDDPTRHVLPLPIIDAILSTAQIRQENNQWYPSPFRVNWGRLVLSKVETLMNEGQYPTASIALAEVFGTMIPSFRDNCGSVEERTLGSKAWELLLHLVDPKAFVIALNESAEELRAHGDIFNYMLNRAYSVSRVRSKSSGIGTAQLKLAERIQEAEEAILAKEREFGSTLREQVVRSSMIPKFERAMQVTRIRFASDTPYEYWTHSSVDALKRYRHVGLWIFNRDLNNALQLFVFKSDSQLEEFKQGAYTHNILPGSVDRDGEWYVHPGYRGLRKRSEHVCPCFKQGLCPTSIRIPLTEAEQAALQKMLKDLSDFAFEQQLKRQEQTLKGMRFEHRRLVDQYMREFDAVQKGRA